MTGPISEWVVSVIEALGYVGVALLVALESLFPPIPSEVVLPMAGFVTAAGESSFLGMVAAATVGSLLGAALLYTVAAAAGPVRLRRLVGRYGRWARVSVTDLERTENWFDRRAGSLVLFGRCVPLVRSLVSIPAGFRGMAPVPFVVYTIIGSLLWNTALIGAGRILGANWHRLERPLDVFQTVVLLVMGGLVVWFVWRRFVRTWLRRV